MSSSRARAKTAGTLGDLGLARNSNNSRSNNNLFTASHLDFLPPSRPRNEHPLNCVTFPNKSELQVPSPWIGSPLPKPKQSHSARRFAKTSYSPVNLSAFALSQGTMQSPHIPPKSIHSNLIRIRKTLDTAPTSGLTSNASASGSGNSKTGKSSSKTSYFGKLKGSLKKPSNNGDRQNHKINSKTNQNPPTAEGKALLETPADTALQLVPISTFSLVKVPGSTSNPSHIGERMQVIRTEEEKARNPDTIRLDKCGLKQFPLISPTGENNLRVLSMQHNQITKLENVPSLNHLVVLDLYDNRIERICGLQGLNSLRVLLLGKNRLRRIEGLDTLKRLEVLDLHGNQLRYVDNLGCLTSLRVLNLAGNNFKTIRLGCFGLTALTELNLKRNRIRSLEGLQKAPHLKKLLLANNELKSSTSLSPLRKLVFLQEILFHPNPMCTSSDYVHHVLSVFPWLETLDRSPVTDEMRTEAKTWHRKRTMEEEERRQEQVRAKVPTSREEVIFEARRHWQSVRNFVKSAGGNGGKDRGKNHNVKPEKLYSGSTAPVGSNLPAVSKTIPINVANLVEMAKDVLIDKKSESLPAINVLAVKTEPLNLPRVASDTELFGHEPTLSTKMQLEAKIESSTILSDAEDSLVDEIKCNTPTSSSNRQKSGKIPSKIAVVRPLIRLNPDVDATNTNSSEKTSVRKEMANQNETSHITNQLIVSTVENMNSEKLRTPGEFNVGAMYNTNPKIEITKCAEDDSQQNDVLIHTTENAANIKNNQKASVQSDLKINQQQLEAISQIEQFKENSSDSETTVQMGEISSPNSSAAVSPCPQALTEAATTESNFNLMTKSIEKNLTQLTSSGTETPCTVTGEHNNPEDHDHDNEPGDLLDIFAKPRNKLKILKRSVSSFNLRPEESDNKNSLPDEERPNNDSSSNRITPASNGGINGNNNNSITKSMRLRAMRNLKSASFDVRYPSTDSDSSDDTSSFITNNTSETSLGPGRIGRKFFVKSKPKMKKEKLVSRNQCSVVNGRRPQTGFVNKGGSTRTLKRCDSAASDLSTTVTTAVKKQGADYLVEIDGKVLNVYGQGALKFTLMGFPSNLASNITTAKFNYISYDTIIPYFGKLRQIYPNLEHFQFRANNLSILAQLNALADLQGLTSIYITKEGNPLNSNELWQSYAVYRLSHWGLKSINGKEVSSELKNGSVSKCFESLGYMALSCLPQTALTPLAKRLHTLHCFCCCSPSSSSDESAKKKPGPPGPTEATTTTSVCSSWDDDPVLLDVIGKEALVYNPPLGGKETSKERSEIPGRIINTGVEILQKLDLLESSWSSVLNELIQDILMDYLLMDNYMKKEYKKLQDVALMNKKFP